MPKRFKLYHSIYMIFWKRQNYRDSKQLNGYHDLRVGVNWIGEAQRIMLSGEAILYDTAMVDTQCYIIVKTHRILRGKEKTLM